MGERFDEAYYRRHYDDPKTAVADAASAERLVAFVAAYLKFLDVDVHRVLDVGCGFGLWAAPLRSRFEGLDYEGLETSAYLCERFGWRMQSLPHIEAAPADLVVCQGVLQYLGDEEADAALKTLAALTKSALYLEALTQRDWEQTVSQNLTDGAVCLRTGAWYRERLRPAFVDAGGGLFLKKDAEIPLYELEAKAP